ncbi:hypothetical protein SO802_014857 [Lithocarpus litseifolius]|uniref:Uncharacterized protein n=1 Tax=Lithocarpus litseifolius TaxID=425828 RepID=A0AAW2CSD8_9ROSI
MKDEEGRGKRSAEAALVNAERQAEGQRVLLRQDEGQLIASKEQIIALKKKLEEAEKAKDQVEKARDQAEQEGYDVGVVETDEALRAEVSGVYRNYFLQAESVYYPPAIRASIPTSSRTDTAPEVSEVGKTSPTKA